MESVGASVLSLVVLLAVSVFHPMQAVKFPNDIDGQPEIECGDLSVRISVKTTSGLASKLYAKGHYVDSSCTFEKTNNGSFSIGSCGMNRQRQLEPRGVSYGLVVVVQLHPMFVTKVDRAYSIKCFYMEAEKTVTSLLDVSMISTQAITGGAPMPVCNYELHADSPNGPSVRYARVGDKVWHTWSCPSSAFGVLVHSCVVTDGQGNDFKVIDEKGCSKDQYVIRTPEYSSDLTRVQQETHVFKFADKTAVVFNCQIRLCQKADNGCEGTSPPKCPGSPPSAGQSEQIVSETPATSSTSGVALNRTSIPDAETTTPAAKTAVSANAAANETNDSTTVAAGNETNAVTGTFPPLHVFPPSQRPFTSSNVLFNSTVVNEGENTSFIFLNETTASPTSLPQGNLFENANETGLKNGTTGIAENLTAPVTESQANATFENTTIADIIGVTDEITPPSTFGDFTSTTNGSDLLNVSVSKTADVSAQANETKVTVFNLTSEGFLFISKMGHRNLSWTREMGDAMTAISSGEGSGYWEPDQSNETSLGDAHQNHTSKANRTATIAPLTLANATIVVVGEDGRGRRNVLSPLLDATNELIKRDDDDRHRAGDRRRLRDQPLERLPDIETDVSQLMWVLEPEEGHVKDEHNGGSDLRHARFDDSFRAFNEEVDEDDWHQKHWPNGRVCLSTRTMIAVLVPLLAIMLFTVAVVVFGLRRLRAQNKLTHFHHAFPLNYLYRRA